MKRILSFLIALCMMCTVLTVPSFAADVKENPEAASTLEALGIIEGFAGDLMLDKVLTRAEFVTMLVRILGVENENKTVYFEDVSATHWAVSAVANACGLGIVQGVDDRHFEPDTPLAYEEAVKMLVNTLGYEPLAIAKGGYPHGYISTAQQIGLLNGIKAQSGLIVKRDLACELIYNALEIDLVTEAAIGSEDIAASIEEGNTLLSSKMNVRKGTGIVNANDVTTLLSAGGIGDGKVKIGDEVFLSGETGAEEYLGYAVTYYADMSTDSAPYTLLYVRVDEKENSVLTVSSADVLPSSTTTQFEYVDEDENEESMDISADADMIYNGVALGGFSASDLKPAYGTVSLLDNNEDGEADVLYVNEYNTIIVDKVNKDTFQAYDKDEASNFVTLDPDAKDYSCIIYRDGKIEDFKVVKANTVLSVATSKNTSGKKKVSVQVSSEQVTGVLESIDDDLIVIGGTEYKVLSSRVDNMTSYIGKEITAFVDVFGTVVGMADGAETSYQYGYLISSDSKSNIDTNVSLKILTSGGKVSVFKCADKVSIDSATPISADKVAEVLEKTARGTAGIGQVIRYRLNSDGEVSGVDTTSGKKVVSHDSEVLDAGDRLTKVVPYGEYIHYYGVLGDIVPEIVFESDTIVFRIPANEFINDDSKYAVGQPTYNNGRWYWAEAYDYSANRGVKVVLVQDPTVAATTINNSAKTTLVDKVTKVIKDGEEQYKLTGFQNGSSTTLYTDDKELFMKPDYKNPGQKVFLEAGDMIRYEPDRFGKVIKVQVMMTDAIHDVPATGTSGYGANVTKFYANHRLTYGYITRKDGMKIIIETNPEDPDKNLIQPYELGSVRYYLVNAKKGTVTKVTEPVLEENIYGRSNAKIALITEGTWAYDVIIYQLD